MNYNNNYDDVNQQSTFIPLLYNEKQDKFLKLIMGIIYASNIKEAEIIFNNKKQYYHSKFSTNTHVIFELKEAELIVERKFIGNIEFIKDLVDILNNKFTPTEQNNNIFSNDYYFN